MLHPELGNSSDPFSTWRVDTREIESLERLYDHHLDGINDSDHLARRLGLLWKKLGSAPHLARLIVDYAHFRLRDATAENRDGTRRPRRGFATFWRSAPNRDEQPRRVFTEDDPLYDRWIDA